MLWNSDSGFLPFLKKKQDNVVIGDFVEYEPLDEKSVLINKIEPPMNQVERLNKKGSKTNLVNNVTQILLVIAPEPKPNYLLIDKFILISESRKTIDLKISCFTSSLVLILNSTCPISFRRSLS